jgi:hypothetical protein
VNAPRTNEPLHNCINTATTVDGRPPPPCAACSRSFAATGARFVPTDARTDKVHAIAPGITVDGVTYCPAEIRLMRDAADVDYPTTAVALDEKQRWYAAGHLAGLVWAKDALAHLSELSTMREALGAVEYLFGSTHALPNELPDDPRSANPKATP